MTATIPPGPTRRPVDARAGTFARAVRFEWVKLRTLRSTWWTAAIAVGVLCLWAFFTVNVYKAMDEARVHLVADAATGGVSFAELALAVLGVLVITNEYSSGTIRTTFAAVPRRTTVLAAKVVTLSGFAAAVVVVGLALACVVARGSFALLGVAFADDLAANAKALAGSGFALLCAALLALGLGTMLRSTAGAVSAVVGILFVAWIALAPFATSETAGTIYNLLPTSAGTWLFSTPEVIRDALEAGYQTLTQAQAFTIVGLWAVVPLLLGGLLINRRDA
ncbi:hypothetical protein ET495_04130 [Xylanimonas allomyrinae]|uniref:ABC transporter permease n=1 Tax=Xylanimonas allomyrinae TaxID=2509459 RepID=A0A4P6EIY7_9MICO|nr:ABC transporter permease [Xylanimonas allomyrinae]QAY62570.1 hypothetical protein ET495_04130 [Xylanimonas allomyrinae]